MTILNMTSIIVARLWVTEKRSSVKTRTYKALWDEIYRWSIKAQKYPMHTRLQQMLSAMPARSLSLFLYPLSIVDRYANR